MSVIPDKLDRPLQIYIGKDYGKLLTVKDSARNPRDMTGYSFKGQVRKCKSDTTALITFESPTSIDITNANIGQIILQLSNLETASLPEVNGVFDLEWATDAGDINIILEGRVTIIKTVTD